MVNPFGLYIIVESDLSNRALDRAIAHTAMTQPRDVIVSSGGQYDRAMQACERIRAIAPHTRITYRKWPNDGAIALFGYNAASLYAAHVKPALSWLKKHNIRFHLDNESVKDNLVRYSDATAQLIAMADSDGIGLAVASFATGNPAERHYAQLDSMWHALAKSPLSFWAPHEYYDMTPQGSAGHIYRFKEAWKRCDQLGIKRPDTCIQEYGLLIKNDPEAGWRRTSMSGSAAAAQGIGYYDSWYKGDGVSVCFYAFCGTDTNNKWRDCSTDDEGFLKAIEDYNAPPVVIPPDPPQEKPPMILPSDSRFKPHILRAATAAKFNVRALPSTSAAVVVTLEPATDYPCYAIPRDQLTAAEKAETTAGANTWHVIELNDTVGYVRSDAGTVTEAVTPPPPPDDTPLTDAERIKYTIENLKMIEYHMQEAYNRIAVVLSAWEKLDNVNV